MADWKKWITINKDKLSLDDCVEDIISEISFNEGARIAKQETIDKACAEFCSHCLKHSMCITLKGYPTERCPTYQSFKNSIEEHETT